MVLDRHRGAIDWLIQPLSRAARNVDPNTITWLSLPFSLLGAFLYWWSDPAKTPYVIFFAGLSVGIASVMDLMDGKIAVMTGKTSKKGDYLDHVIDRFSDTAIFTAIALSAWTDLRVGIFAVVGILLTSYMGTQAQAVGIGRNYGGILGRADRLVLLFFATVIDLGRIHFDWQIPTWLHLQSALDAMMWWYAIAANLTAIQRFAQGLKWFDRPAA